MADPIPQPRVDTLVTDPATGAQRRRTEYCGTVWYGAPPNTSGGMVAFTRSLVRDATPFFLPDSQPYRRAELADAVVTCGVAIQAHSGEASFVKAAEASFADDPRGGDRCWVALLIDVYGQEPLAVSYRVVALCDPAAVADTAP